MNAMLTKYLKDFSVPAPAGPMGGDILNGLHDPPPPEMDFDFEPEPAIDLEAERREAREEGYREASDALEARHAAELQALRDEHAAELRDMADMHENNVVAMIHTRFHEMTHAIAQTVMENTLQVLLPVFEEEVCNRAIDNLAVMTRDTLVEASGSTVVVRGPFRLYEALRPMFERDGIASRFIETEDVDIAVEINDLVLVTRLSSWSKALSEVTE